MSEWAPSIITLKIDPEKIRDVIGKGGAVIRQITEETGTTIDIENDGTVKIASVSGAAGREAQARIELITADVEVGRIYEGKVVRLMDFGAFVTILPGRDGLVHISQISEERVERVVGQAQGRRQRARQGARGRPPGSRAPVDAERRRRLIFSSPSIPNTPGSCPSRTWRFHFLLSVSRSALAAREPREDFLLRGLRLQPAANCATRS